MTIASRAFRPFHGSAAAWACSPWKITSTSSDASGCDSTWLRSHGWNISAASIPANRPSSIIHCLPLPRSSAGVPRNTISPGSSSATEARAIAAPTPEAAIVLWPQPWPSPGSASYSARIPIRGAVPPPSAAARRPDRGLEPARRVLDLEAVTAEDLGDPDRPPCAPRTPAPGWRGSGATGRGSRLGRRRQRPRAAPSRPGYGSAGFDG